MDLTQLSQLSSADIKNIEVITNPGAKYDASVKSVIRIQTKRPQGDGFGMTIRTQGVMQNIFVPLTKQTSNSVQADLNYLAISAICGVNSKVATKLICSHSLP